MKKPKKTKLTSPRNYRTVRNVGKKTPKRVNRSKRVIRKRGKKSQLFYDANADFVESDKIVFIQNPFHVTFFSHFFQKFNEWNLWKVLTGTFCCALFIRQHWNLTAIISFVILLLSYLQWRREERSRAVEYCAKKISKNPDRLKRFLATVSAPKNVSTGKSGDSPCEWINDILAKFWPYINSIAQKQIDEKGFSKKGLDVGNGHKIYLDRFTLGDKPPALTSINVLQTGHRRDEIAIFLKLIYFGNCLILFSYKTKIFLTAKAGVKDFYFRGNAIIVLRPILEVPPFIGGISVCLQEIPLVDYEGINLANIADNSLFKRFISNILNSYLVSPNKIYLPLLNNSNIKRELKYPLPVGLCYIQILEAENLPAMDTSKLLIFAGSSDSFCKVKVGDYVFTTTIIYSSLNPYFGESFSAPIHDFNQNLKIEILDKDALNINDSIGVIEFSLNDIAKNKNMNGKDKWLPVGKSPTGSLHFRIAIFELSSNKRNIAKIKEALKQSTCDVPLGILSVYIYYVRKLHSEDSSEINNPFVKMKFSEQTFETKTSSKPPEKGYYYFEEGSHFVCRDLQHEFLEISVAALDANTQTLSQVFGGCNIAVKDIINSKKDMLLNKEFIIKKMAESTGNENKLKDSGFIRLFFSLKVCKYRKRIIENLRIPSNIQANIEQTSTNENSLYKMFREPRNTFTNPINSVKTIRKRILPFSEGNKTIVAEDILPVPINLSEGCWVKIRIKWPDRRALHIEVLRIINIPLEIIDQNFKFAVCVKLSIKQDSSGSSSRGFTSVVKRRIKFGSNSGTEEQNELKRKHLQKRYTQKYGISDFSTDIVYNERLIFRISPNNNIDNHVLEFFLILCQPRKFFAVVYDSRVMAFSQPMDIPTVDFKGDPVERWYSLELYDKFKNTKK